MSLPRGSLRSVALCFTLFALGGCSRTSSWSHPYMLSVSVSGLKRGQAVTIASWSFRTGQQSLTLLNNGRREFPQPLYAYIGHTPIPIKVWIVQQPAHDGSCGFTPSPVRKSVARRRAAARRGSLDIPVECGLSRERFPTTEVLHPWRSGGGWGLSMYAAGLAS